jgi:opacity protein-like surface antigen
MKTLRMVLLGLMTLIGVIASTVSFSSAADLGRPYQAPAIEQPAQPVIAAATGFRCSAHIGLGATLNGLSATDTLAATTERHALSGAAVPLGAGCDYTFGRFFVGGEGQFVLANNIDNTGLRINSFWDISARFGYNIHSALNVYAKVGYAQAKVGDSSNQMALRGIPIGLGTEIALWHNLALRTEYTHISWRDVNAGTDRLSVKTDIITAAVVVKF